MHKEEVEATIDRIVNNVARVARTELDPTNIIDIGSKRNIYNLIREDVREELMNIKISYKNQTDLLIKYHNNNYDEEEFKRKAVKKDYFYQNRSIHNEEFKNELQNYYLEFANGISLLLSSDIQKFEEVLKREEQLGVLDLILRRGEIYRNYKHNLQLEIRLDNSIIPIRSVEYTNEAIRVLDKSEEKTRNIMINRI